jgi:hypothetical protein
MRRTSASAGCAFFEGFFVRLVGMKLLCILWKL